MIIIIYIVDWSIFSYNFHQFLREKIGISFISVRKIADTFFPSLEISKLKEFLNKRSFDNENGCTIWLWGVDRDHYGVARVTIDNKRIRFAAHRLMYYVSLEGKFFLNLTMHISHICHEKLCINLISCHMSQQL